MDNARIKIAICVITYNRIEDLERLLKSLNKLEFADNPPEIKIVVVDNDPIGSARDICESLRKELCWPLVYGLEPSPGIPAARNCAMELVYDEVSWIAFLDDDEAPDTNWLDQLLRVQREYEADVVAGPVLPVLSAPIPIWMGKGRFFYRRRFVTGDRLSQAASGNVLFRSAILRSSEHRFDERFALVGGSDRHFFQRIGMAGYKMVWADEALVYEWVRPNRACARWLIKRQFSHGNIAGLVDMDLRPSVVTFFVLMGKAFYWIVQGIIRLPIGLFARIHLTIRGLQFIAYGFGIFAGLAGMRYEQYRAERISR